MRYAVRDIGDQTGVEIILQTTQVLPDQALTGFLTDRT